MASEERTRSRRPGSGGRHLAGVSAPLRIWPAGRYEFHVYSGNEILALTICMARLG